MYFKCFAQVFFFRNISSALNGTFKIKMFKTKDLNIQQKKINQVSASVEIK